MEQGVIRVVARIRQGFGGLGRGGRVRIGNPIGPLQPASQIDQAAACGAEGSVGVSVVHAPLAYGTAGRHKGSVAWGPPAAAMSDPSSRASTAPGARWAVGVLTAMNLLNYLDRYVPSAVKDLFKRDLHLTDAETSLPLTAFVIVYMLASPVFGSLSDRGSRRTLIAAGVALWSLATAGAALARGFWTFLLARALVGIGEAAYATITPSLIADFYPPERRNRIMTIFYVAIPVGAALGFTLGGLAGGAWGWRAAFLLCGLPGLGVALLTFTIRDPGRGRFDTGPKAAAPGWAEALKTLRQSRSFVNAVLGYTAVTFAAGGMADWFPTFLSRHRGMTLAEAASLVGTVTVIGGLAGTACGGLLADTLRRHTRQPYLALSGLSMVPATLCAALALVVPGHTAIVAAIFGAQFFLWFYNGPINALIANSVPSSMVARAFAVSILSIHLFGDAISPPIIGAISDATGNLPLGVALVPVAMGVGSIVWLVGWRRV
jgi:MFS transporter, Spinster family, sphingosine-1-phosphate transporter